MLNEYLSHFLQDNAFDFVGVTISPLSKQHPPQVNIIDQYKIFIQRLYCIVKLPIFYFLRSYSVTLFLFYGLNNLFHLRLNNIGLNESSCLTPDFIIISSDVPSDLMTFVVLFSSKSYINSIML